MPHNKIKVLFLTPSIGSGGAERQIVRLSNSLNKEILDITIAALRVGGGYEDLLNNKVKIDYLSGGIIRSSLLSHLLGRIKLPRLILRHEPDVIHSNQTLLNIICIKTCESINYKGRVILGIQNNLTSELNGIPYPVRNKLKDAVLNSFKRADKVVALSRGVASDLFRHSPELEKRTTVIYNACVDDNIRNSMQEPITYMKKPDVPVLLACGRLVHQKDYPTLLRAVKIVKQHMPVEVWILGEGPLRKKLEIYAESLGVHDNVRFLGFQKNPFKFFAAADVFVLSSVHEGFGNVIVEAMACDLPVISTDCPFGPNEIIQHEWNGILTRPGDYEGMAKWILKLLTDQTLRITLAEKAKLQLSRFEAKTVAEQYEEVFIS